MDVLEFSEFWEFQSRHDPAFHPRLHKALPSRWPTYCHHHYSYIFRTYSYCHISFLFVGRNNVNCSHDVLIYMDKTCGKKRWIIFPFCKTLPLWERKQRPHYEDARLLLKRLFNETTWVIKLDLELQIVHYILEWYSFTRLSNEVNYLIKV